MKENASSPAPIIEALVAKAKAAAGASVSDRGFIGGAAGLEKFQQYAPTRATLAEQINQPLGQAKADEIATALGLKKDLCLTTDQFARFVSGNSSDGGVNAAYAQVVVASLAIFTNTKPNPCFCDINVSKTGPRRTQRWEIVLGSYGLIVDPNGLLMSPANVNAPSRQVNQVLQPGGYLRQWAAANDAKDTLRMLDTSAYSEQLPFGIAAQHEGTDAELALYVDGDQTVVVGLSVTPSLWEINFCLIYALNPMVAAMMPAYWHPIPNNVVEALEKSALEAAGIDEVDIPNQVSGGMVPFIDYASEFDYAPRIP